MEPPEDSTELSGKDLPFTVLAAQIRRLQCFVCVLLASCILLVVTCTGAAVYLTSSFNTDLNTLFPAFSSQTGELDDMFPEYRYCCNKSDLDRQRFVLTDFDYRTSGSGLVCFSNLSWIVHLITFKQSEIEQKVHYLDHKINNFQQNLSSNETQAPSTVLRSLGAQFPAGQGQRPFAHLLLDVKAQYSDLANDGPLKWTKSGIDSSYLREFDVKTGNEELKIRHSGYYIVYSGILLKTRNVTKGEKGQQPLHKVYKNYRDESQDGKTVLLESNPDNIGPVSYLLGVFLMKQGDSLAVCVPTGRLRKDSGRFNYLGAILIAT